MAAGSGRTSSIQLCDLVTLTGVVMLGNWLGLYLAKLLWQEHCARRRRGVWLFNRLVLTMLTLACSILSELVKDDEGTIDSASGDVFRLGQFLLHTPTAQLLGLHTTLPNFLHLAKNNTAI